MIIELQFRLARQKDDSPHPSAAKDIQTRNKTQREAYGLIVPLFIVAIYFYYDTPLDPYAPLFTWSHVGWFLDLYFVMPKKGNTRGREIDGASPSMLAKLQMVMNGMYVRERQMFNSWGYLRESEFDFKDKYFAENYDDGKPANHANPMWENPLRNHRQRQQSAKMNNEKPAADTILNGCQCRLDIAEFFGVIHRLVGTWTEASVRSRYTAGYRWTDLKCRSRTEQTDRDGNIER